MNRWWGFAKWLLRIVGLAIDVIGFAGIPGDWQAWDQYLGGLSEASLQILLGVVGTSLVIVSFEPWRRRTKVAHGAEVALHGAEAPAAISGSRNVQQINSPGAIQAARDILNIQNYGQSEYVDAVRRARRGLRRASVCAMRLTQYVSYRDAKNEQEAFLLALSDVRDAAEELSTNSRILSLIAEIETMAEVEIDNTNAGYVFGNVDFQESLRRLNDELSRRKVVTGGVTSREQAQSDPERLVIGDHDQAYHAPPPIEVVIQEHSSVIVTPAFSSTQLATPDLSEVSANLYLKLLNNDAASTRVERIWLQIEGEDPVPNAPSEEQLKGNPEIAGRNVRHFLLRHRKLYKGKLDEGAIMMRLMLRVKALGFPICEQPLPTHCFTFSQYNEL